VKVRVWDGRATAQCWEAWKDWACRKRRVRDENSYGPGYRLYYTRQGDVLYLLLIGGDKGSQKRDIKSALERVTTLRKDRP
jgi:putative addiction module killer protein